MPGTVVHDMAMSQDESAATNEPHEDDALDRKIADQPSIAPGGWVVKTVLVLVGIAGAYILFRTSAAYFPRWWAQRVADQVQGGLTAGTLWGLFYGFVFTFVPLLLLLQIRRHFFNWTWRFVVVVVAVLLAAPNWLTLSVVAGSSKAARDGESIFNLAAPNFRAGTLVGVCVGVAAALALTVAGMVAKRRKNQVKQLRGQLAERDKSEGNDDESL